MTKALNIGANNDILKIVMDYGCVGSCWFVYDLVFRDTALSRVGHNCGSFRFLCENGVGGSASIAANHLFTSRVTTGSINCTWYSTNYVGYCTLRCTPGAIGWTPNLCTLFYNATFLSNQKIIFL